MKKIQMTQPTSQLQQALGATQGVPGYVQARMVPPQKKGLRKWLWKYFSIFGAPDRYNRPLQWYNIFWGIILIPVMLVVGVLWLICRPLTGLARWLEGYDN